MQYRPPVRGIALALVAVLATGCALRPAGRGLPPEGRVITYEQMERAGARNAWEAIERTGTHIRVRESGFAKPADLTWRGRGSIMLSAAPVVYIDGTQTSDFRRLQEIPLHHIELIRIYNGVQGTKYFGTGGGNGVILVLTRTTPVEERAPHLSRWAPAARPAMCGDACASATGLQGAG